MYSHCCSKTTLVENELKTNPLTLYGGLMKNVQMEKYLGDMISSGGLADSVQATVLKRKGQVVSCILETTAVVEDCRSGVVGGIMAGIEIWEMAILPFLLNNSETWTEMSKKSVETLDELQCMFYRYLMATPRSCPIPALLWETGGITMEHRIAKTKLLFYHHLINLPEGSLALEVANTQKTLSYPGLVEECHTLIDKYELPDVKYLSRIQWKKLVKAKVKEANKND